MHKRAMRIGPILRFSVEIQTTVQLIEMVMHAALIRIFGAVVTTTMILLQM